MIKNASTDRALGRIARATAASALLALTVVACRGRGTPDGYQGVVEHDERVVGFEVAGRIERVRVQRGDRVKAGDILAVVEDTNERLARDARADEARAAAADLALLEAGSRKEDVAALTSQARAAEATEALLRRSRDRARALHDTQSISEAELDRSQGELDRAIQERAAASFRAASLRGGARPEEIARAKARSEAAVSALSLAETRLARHEVHVLSEGTVLDIHVDPGELAGVGTPVATIADAAHPYVDVFVPQAELSGIAVGKKATVRIDGSDSATPGAVEHVATRTEFTPRFLFSERERPNLVVRVRVRVFDPAQNLHAGIPAFVVIQR